MNEKKPNNNPLLISSAVLRYDIEKWNVKRIK